jgi:hypothetical protein
MDFGIAQIVAHYSSLGYSAGDMCRPDRPWATLAEDPWAAYLKPGDIIEAHIAASAPCGIGCFRRFTATPRCRRDAGPTRVTPTLTTSGDGPVIDERRRFRAIASAGSRPA